MEQFSRIWEFKKLEGALMDQGLFPLITSTVIKGERPRHGAKEFVGGGLECFRLLDVYRRHLLPFMFGFSPSPSPRDVTWIDTWFHMISFIPPGTKWFPTLFSSFLVFPWVRLFIFPRYFYARYKDRTRAYLLIWSRLIEIHSTSEFSRHTLLSRSPQSYEPLVILLSNRDFNRNCRLINSEPMAEIIGLHHN